jgi:hypothetical protein
MTTPPTTAELKAWVDGHNLNVSSFIDAPDSPAKVIDVFQIRETAIIISVPSMQIVWVDHGDITGTMPSSINAAAKEMHTLLGK